MILPISCLVALICIVISNIFRLAEANAASRAQYRTYAERTGSYWQYYGYPRPQELRDCLAELADKEKGVAS
jgi:hypothetical protein